MGLVSKYWAIENISKMAKLFVSRVLAFFFLTGRALG